MEKVELVYLSAGGALKFHEKTAFIPGMTVTSLLQETNFFKLFPDMQDAQMGIFSVRVKGDMLLQPGDRLEMYRPLLSDPKDKRRQRAVR